MLNIKDIEKQPLEFVMLAAIAEIKAIDADILLSDPYECDAWLQAEILKNDIKEILEAMKQTVPRQSN